MTLRYYGRNDEERALPLTRCDGTAHAPSVDLLSVLTRPRGVEVPREPREGEFIADDIRRLDPQLLVLLQRLADEWPGRTIEIVSGYRPRARPGSRHRGGHALDVRVVGVHRARVAALGRTWARSGVGFYPNSTFTHLDVRDAPAFWVDESAPGQSGRYVSNADEEAVFAAALAQADVSETPGVETPGSETPGSETPGSETPVAARSEDAVATARPLGPAARSRSRRDPRSPLDPVEVRAAARAAMEVLLDDEPPAREPERVHHVVVATPPPPIDWAPPW